MRRKVVSPVLVFVTICLLAVAVLADLPVSGEMELDFYPENPVWRGTISGDINGNMFFTNVGPGKRGEELRGQTISFEEIWLITDDNENMLLTGTDAGIVSPNSKYRMNGEVTDASPEWSHLIGHTVHMSGHITWDPESGMPLTAPGTFRVN